MNIIQKLCYKYIVVFIMLLCIWSGTNLIVNAQSADDTVEQEMEQIVEAQVIGEKRSGENVKVTHSSPRVVDGIYYTILSVDGKQAYCIQSSKDTPAEAVYEVAAELRGQDSLLNKVMYYAYGNPGYRADIWVEDCPNDTTRAYLRSHIVMSYVYDSANTLKREIKDDDWVKWWKSYIQRTIEKIKNEPDIPATKLEFERSKDIAYFERDTKSQRTDENMLHGDSRNKITFALPDYVTLVNETTGLRMEEEAVLSGGDRFYFYADAGNLNGETIRFDHLRGTIQEEWATLVVKTGTNKQDIGYGVWKPVREDEFSLEIQWLPKSELDIVKNVTEEGNVYHKGDVIPYRIEVYQTVENAVAKALYIEDMFLGNGASILYDTIRITDGTGTEIADATIVETPQGFQICGGDVLSYLEFSEEPGIIVEYQVVVESNEITVLENKATVRCENAPEDEDDEDVPIEPIPEPEPEPEKEVAPKTGDETNLLVLWMVFVSVFCSVTVAVCQRAS